MGRWTKRGMLVSGYPLLQFRQDERQLARQEGCHRQPEVGETGPAQAALIVLTTFPGSCTAPATATIEGACGTA